MKKFVLQILITAVAFFAAITLLTGRGVEARGDFTWLSYLVLALIFGVTNAVLRPIITLLGCPFIILTLGLGVLLINTLLFFLTGVIGDSFGVGFSVDGFVPAFLGALIVSLVSGFFQFVLRDEMK